MMGWYTHHINLTQLFTNTVSTPFNIALFFFLTGTSILFCKADPLKISGWLAVVIFYLAGLSYMQYLFHIDVGLNRFFIFDPADPMGYSTSFCFMLVGAMLGLSCFFKQLKWASYLALMLNIAIGFLGLILFICSNLNIQIINGWTFLTNMSYITQIGLIMTSLASFPKIFQNFSYYQSSNNYALTILVGFTSFIIFFIVYEALIAHQNFLVKQTIQKDAAHGQFELMETLGRKINAFSQLAARQNVYTKQQSQARIDDINYYFSDYRSAKSIVKENNHHQLQFFPRDKITQATEQQDYNSCLALLNANTQRTINQEKKLVMNDKLLCIKDTATNIMIIFDAKELFSTIFKFPDWKTYNIELILNEKIIFFKNVSTWSAFDKQLGISNQFLLYGNPGQLRIWLDKIQFDKKLFYFSNIFLFFGVLLSGTLSIMVRLWQISTLKNKQLLSEKKLFSLIFENSLPCIIVNKTGIIQSVNQNAINITGYDIEQLIGMPIEIIIPERFHHQHIDQRNSYMKNPIHRPMGKAKNLIILSKTKEEIPVEISLMPIVIGDEPCILCTIIDNRFREQNQKILAESEKRYRQLYELMNEGYCIITLIFDENKKPIDFIFTKINPAFEKQTGLKDAQGKRALELMPTLEEKWIRVFAKVAATGEPVTIENYTHSLKRWYHSYAFQFGAPQNNQVGIIFSDITERKKNEGRLLTYARNTQLIYNTVQIASSSLHTETILKNCLSLICQFINFQIGHIYFVNRKVAPFLESAHIWYLKNQKEFDEFKLISEKMTFLSGVGLPGRILESKKLEWITDINLESNFLRKIACKKINIHSAIGFPILVNKEVVAVFELFSTEMHYSDEQLIHAFSVIGEHIGSNYDRCMTHQKLTIYSEELKKSNEILDEFTYIASHDLKEPMRGINNFSNFILEDYADKLDKPGKEKLITLRKIAIHMNELIDSLLLYSRVGHIELLLQKCNIDKKIHEKIAFLDPILKEKNANIIINKNLPIVLCDPILIGEVFQNLILNGIKYNDNSKKEIEIDYEEDLDNYIFSVKDNGIGIPEEHYEHIFKIFKRLHGKDEYGGGSGAGMTIVKRIIERHGGKIWLDSTMGAGTIFYFTMKKCLLNR